MNYEAIEALTREVEREGRFAKILEAEIGKAIVGQKRMVDRLLIGLLADGHILLEGVPGLAKTTAVKAVARAIAVDFHRIQFTPDLLPADLIGTLIYNQRDGLFQVRKGPIFANFVLADEINRAPAKVQSALLEAMQERQVTIGEETFHLPSPFLVLATQNPIEQEGTYPLPEAQTDRFMFKVLLDYPERTDELEILRRGDTSAADQVDVVVQPAEILSARNLVGRIYVDEKVENYVLDVVTASRQPGRFGLEKLRDKIRYGASPRASIFLVRAARAHAFLRGRGYVTPEDIRAIGFETLRHRIMVTFEAEADEVTADDIIRDIFDHIEVP
ncbi:MAG: AAA family ATPase [Calditrichaeota bacterium]|nr:AAA family ATPase [Calditrichota bacterium]